MVHLETNIYLIDNLADLNCKYKVYRVKGLAPESEDFHRNTQFLIDKLSRGTKSPCALFRATEGVFIAQPEGYPDLPATYELIRAKVIIEKQSDLRELNFNSLDSQTSKIALRFLKFAIDGCLHANPALWLPHSGASFFNKEADPEFNSNAVDLYRGFAIRLISLDDGKIGICVDTRNKYVSKIPLPTKFPTADEFRKKYKGLNCLYEYGNIWYEIRIEALSDLTVSEVSHPEGGTLYDDVHRKAGKVKSPNLLALPQDCSVLIYYTSRGEQRNVPSGLCRPTFNTEHPDIRDLHQRTLKPPIERRKEIQIVVDRYLGDLRLGNTKIVLSQKPSVMDTRVFKVPELEFGNKKILSLQNNGHVQSIPFSDFGKKKREFMYSQDAGLFVRKPFDRQYIILPKSIHESFGKLFIEDIKREIGILNPTGKNLPYELIEIPYNDSIQKSVHNLAQEILKAVDEYKPAEGFGIVMIPTLSLRTSRKEDQLANFVMRKLRERNLYVSVIHDSTVKRTFEKDGSQEVSGAGWRHTSSHDQLRVYRGYVKNVVLNKILLLNSYWPFVLKTALNADLTIGIDVKNNTAGFTLVYKSGGEIRFFSSESDQREQLSKGHIRTRIIEILREERELLLSKNVKNIVIQRQGRLFNSEKDGIVEALKIAAQEQLISSEYACTFVDIRKTAGLPFRLFEVVSNVGTQGEFIRNPKIGSYVTMASMEGFICNTGYPFQRRGTVRPLHVIKIEGNMPIESILQDVFYLSNLTWTKVDDCSRDPLTVKMNDIRLREIAGEYSQEALDFGDEEGGAEDE